MVYFLKQKSKSLNFLLSSIKNDRVIYNFQLCHDFNRFELFNKLEAIKSIFDQLLSLWFYIFLMKVCFNEKGFVLIRETPLTWSFLQGLVLNSNYVHWKSSLIKQQNFNFGTIRQTICLIIWSSLQLCTSQLNTGPLLHSSIKSCQVSAKLLFDYFSFQLRWITSWF